jgi:hypothetical protein
MNGTPKNQRRLLEWEQTVFKVLQNEKEPSLTAVPQLFIFFLHTDITMSYEPLPEFSLPPCDR